MSGDFVPPGGPAPAGPPASEPARPGAGAAAQPAPPYGSQPAAATVARPRTVDLAYWLYLAAAGLSVVGLIVSFLSIDAAREQALRQLEAQGQRDLLSPEAVDAAVWTGVAIGVIFSLVFAAAYVVFAILLRRGYGWARWVLGALAVLALPGLIGGFGVGALMVLCLAAGTVLVFLPASNAYFRSTAQARSGGRP